jgi:hypothetical protein
MRAELGPRFVEMKRWSESLRGVPHHVDIMLVCDECGMRRPMGRSVLEDVAGGEENLSRIEARLRCSNCHAKRGRVLLGYYTSDPA